MREQKYYLVFDEIERRVILRSLNELLIKFVNAKKKKFKII